MEERTLSIIKPDGVERNLVGKIISKFEENGIRVIAMKRILLTVQQASIFYAIHKERAFYRELVEYMTSGPVVVMVLEGKDVIARNREIMGATDPSKALKGTIRKEFALSIQMNTVHGSDSVENAKEEISYFFSETEILGSPMTS
ncbi:MAG: nucleoside-diphosphate kinase [Oligoflexales bacterium]|nr:nucleoside-diphosphate kinase [Oligoflexales bacterium]